MNLKTQEELIYFLNVKIKKYLRWSNVLASIRA